MYNWVDKSKTSAILNVAPGISAGVQLLGKTWTINIVGTKTESPASDIEEAKSHAENLLSARLSEAQKAVNEIIISKIPIEVFTSV